MVAAVRVHKHGGPEVLTFEDIEVPAPGQGQVKSSSMLAGSISSTPTSAWACIRRRLACPS